jgi:hypothetical protein
MVSLVFHAYLSSTKRSFLNSFKSESSHSAKEKPDMEGKKKREREREREREKIRVKPYRSINAFVTFTASY